jgi:hypothetical protein
MASPLISFLDEPGQVARRIPGEEVTFTLGFPPVHAPRSGPNLPETLPGSKGGKTKVLTATSIDPMADLMLLHCLLGKMPIVRYSNNLINLNINSVFMIMLH